MKTEENAKARQIQRILAVIISVGFLILYSTYFQHIDIVFIFAPAFVTMGFEMIIRKYKDKTLAYKGYWPIFIYLLTALIVLYHMIFGQAGM